MKHTQSADRRLVGPTLAGVFAGLLLMAGCSSSSPEQQIEQARTAYQAARYHTAEVRLKSVLQKDGHNGNAWALLGKVSLASHDYDDAIFQFDRARAAGRSAASLAVVRAQALIARGRYDDALAALDQADDTAAAAQRAAAATLRGRALAGRGDLEPADAAYAQALQIDPELSAALQGQARLAMHRGDLASAHAALARAVAAHPDDAAALSLLGRIDFSQEHCGASLAHLGRAMQLGGSQMSRRQRQGNHLLLASCHLRADDAQAAQQNIHAVLATDHDNPSANYLQALIEIRNGRYREAANRVQAVLNRQPDSVRSLLLMGWLRIAQNRPAAAGTFLNRVLELSPDNMTAVRLQTGLMIADHQDDAARDLLERTLKDSPDDPRQHAALAAIMARLNAREPQSTPLAGIDSVTLQLDLARSLAANGNAAAARTILSRIQPTGPAEARALAITTIRLALTEDDVAAAITQAEALARKTPDDADASTLLAAAYAGADRFDDAADVLARAAKTHPGDDDILRAQAQLALQRGNLAGAIADMKRLVARSPDSLDDTLMLAGLYARAGDIEQRIALLRGAAQHGSSDNALDRALARAYLDARRTRPALALIDRHLDTDAPDPDWLHLQGIARIQNNQGKTGLESLDRAAARAPDRPAFALDAAKAAYALGQPQAATARLQTLRRRAPNYWPAAGFLALAQSRAGNVKAALGQVAALRGAGQGYEADILEGAVRRNVGQLTRADQAYARAYNRQPSAGLAVLRFRTRQAGGLADPAEPLEQWLRRRPDDASVALVLADYDQHNGRIDSAIQRYRQVLAKQPDSVVALNNLAALTGDRAPAQAQTLAEHAHRLAPDSPAVMDTLGWILVQRDRIERGVALLDRAEAAARGQSPTIRFHLGSALAERGQPGDAKRARALLQQAVSAGLPEKQSAHARTLLSRI